MALLAALGLPVHVVACARSVDRAEVAKPPSAPLGKQGVAPGAPSVAWSGKTPEQRMEFMGLYFHPRMKELFQKSDPTAYGNFRCQTCHGEDMEARGFAMPAALGKLAAADPVVAGRSRDAKVTDFMVSAVLPATVELLAGSDPGARARISCLTCHAPEPAPLP